MRGHSVRKDKNKDEVPEVSWDFNTYMDGLLHTINGKDRKSGSAISFAVPTKADNPWVSRKIHEELKLLGRTSKVLLKTDQESGLEGILDQVQILRNVENMDTLREQSRPHEHQSNGAAESINHQVARHASLILSELEDRIGSPLQKDRNYILWLPEYAAMVKTDMIRKMGVPHIIESMGKIVMKKCMNFVKRLCTEYRQIQRKLIN